MRKTPTAIQIVAISPKSTDMSIPPRRQRTGHPPAERPALSSPHIPCRKSPAPPGLIVGLFLEMVGPELLFPRLNLDHATEDFPGRHPPVRTSGGGPDQEAIQLQLKNLVQH